MAQTHSSSFVGVATKSAIVFGTNPSQLRFQCVLRTEGRSLWRGLFPRVLSSTPVVDPVAEAIQIEINNRRRVKGEKLRKQQTTDDRDSHWSAQFTPCSGFQGQGQRAKQGRCRRHHDWAK